MNNDIVKEEIKRIKYTDVSRELRIALDICMEAHKGEFRNDSVTPYHTHPIIVSTLVNTEEEKIVALLHDVLESGKFKPWYIEKLFGAQCLFYIRLLTRLNSEPYLPYINDLSKYKVTRNVKVADITHNLVSEPSEHAKSKYFKAMKILLKEM